MIGTKSLIIVPDSSEWYISLTVEGSLFLQSRGHLVEIIFILNQNQHISDEIKKHIAFLESKNITVKITYMNRKIFHKIKLKRYRYFDENYKIQKFCFPTLVEIAQEWNINVYKIRNLVSIMRQLQIAHAIWDSLQMLTLSRFDKFYTINGRFTGSATVVGFLKTRGIKTSIFEFGAGPERFRIFPSSAQNSRELEKLVKEDWFEAPIETRKIIAENYFKEKKTRDPISGISWTENMQRGKLPRLPTGKKICTFFPTSQIEFVGMDPNDLEMGFASQLDAVNCLIRNLKFGEWHLVIRKHPLANHNSKGSAKDDKLNELKENENISIIEPDSSVDSYELAARSDLVVTYGSSIGTEISFESLAPVLTLAYTPWYFCDPDRHVFDEATLIKKLSEDIPKIDGNRLLPYGYSAARGGIKFKYLAYKNGKWLL